MFIKTGEMMEEIKNIILDDNLSDSAKIIKIKSIFSGSVEKETNRFVELTLQANRTLRLDEYFPKGVKLLSAKVISVNAGTVFNNIKEMPETRSIESNHKFIKRYFTSEIGQEVIEGKLIFAPYNKVIKIDLAHFSNLGDKGIIYEECPCLIRFEITDDVR